MNVEPDLLAVASENLEPLAADASQSLTRLSGKPICWAPLRRAIESNTLHSFILWGPPGLVKPPCAIGVRL